MRLNRILAALLAALAISSVPLQSLAATGAKVYRTAGANRMVVASGGEIDVLSGGALKSEGVAVNVSGLTNTSQTSEGLTYKRIARAVYDVATDLGTVGAHGLGVTLPAKALIMRSWLYIVTQFADSGSGTVAISCEDANNIKTATDITGSSAGAFIEGQSTGAVSAAVGSIAADCEITATVATASQSAGKAIIFVEYVVGE